VRCALLPLRRERLGSILVDEMNLVRCLASRTTLLQLWDVVRTVALRSRS